MQKAGLLPWIGLLAFALCASVVAFASPVDDERDFYENRRVARITLTRGDVQIRRAGNKEWEEAAPNVPLLEGDRLATGDDSYLEIQFNNRNYLRVDEYSLLQIVTLRNEGIALSLPEGAISLRLSDFKREKEYFEIDAPNTTVAARKEGLYRVDAPRENRDEREVLVTVTGGGEARVYTQSSGFSIRNGRLARVFLEGDYAGEFELTAARSFSDDFDRWVAEREDKLSRRRSDYAYYDPQIYGADELYDYGEWIYTDNYGYVWRPNRNAIASYRDWSPYRYGHWRYLPVYGWTWIADEPWGWATSHYGRWVYINGYWNWCPYDSWRSRRVYWQPSLAIFVNIGRRVCWYPMPYNAGYRYVNRSRTVIYNNTTIINNNAQVGPTKRDFPITKSDPLANQIIKRDLETVYAKAVTGVPVEEFGKGRGISRPIALEQGKGALDIRPIVDDSKLPAPPRGKTDLTVGREREIVGKRPSFEKAEQTLETGKIGAAMREKGVQLDERLSTERIFKGRVPAERGDRQPDANNNLPTEKRNTGVFDRRADSQVYRPEDPNRDNKGDVDRPVPRQSRPRQKSDEDNPVYRPEPQRPTNKRGDEDDNRRSPVYSPPRRDEQPRYEPPPRREEPRKEAPPRREEPRYEPPTRREEPRNDPPAKQREEPQRAEPPKKEEPGSAPPSSKKDNRR